MSGKLKDLTLTTSAKLQNRGCFLMEYFFGKPKVVKRKHHKRNDEKVVSGAVSEGELKMETAHLIE